ncbi:hypothetical protein LR69_04398 [Geobacillus sp. BCO2]|nr:hypothetical protein LR69_04398 [Geobacillus sp. BCO2]
MSEHVFGRVRLAGLFYRFSQCGNFLFRCSRASFQRLTEHRQRRIRQFPRFLPPAHRLFT